VGAVTTRDGDVSVPRKKGQQTDVDDDELVIEERGWCESFHYSKITSIQ